jgi:peroxiredoxin
MKQTIITILLAFFAIVGQAQEFTPVVEDSIDFVINGTTTSTEDSVAVFPYLTSKDWRMSFYPITGGQFKVTGRMPRHSFIQIGDGISNNGLYFNVIVEETPTDINLVTGEVKGSELQQRFIRCQIRERESGKETEAWFESLREDDQKRIWNMSIGREQMKTAQDSANVKKYNDYRAELSALTRKLVRENKDNIISAFYLYLIHDELTPEEEQEFMREDAPYAHHPAMERPWKSYWEKQKQRGNIGNVFIDFEAEAPDGTKHRLSEYAGKGQYVLIDFWASWCGPCIGSFPMMKQLHEAYKDRGLHIVGVSCDKDREAWLKALDKHQLPWTALLSPSAKGDACSLYGVSGIPTVILIAPDGKILSTDLEAGKLKEKLAEIFGE